MDKNEYNSKLQEIDKCVDQGNYAEAARIADQIDWRRVRNIRTLCLISEIYEAEHRYEDSKALLIRAYKKSPVGRAILYRLVEVSIKLKQFDEAINYYTEYVQAAPHDTSRYILKYKIYRGRGSSLNEQIEILQEYLKEEYNEKYAYELARLYQEADRIAECLATCDDLVLWFHSGKYVIKALELKKRYASLTPKQQEIYDHRFDEEEELDDEEIGQEKQMVSPEDTSLAESIVEDTTREIADEVARASAGEDGSMQDADDNGADENGSAAGGEAAGQEQGGSGILADPAVSGPDGEDALDEPVKDAVAFDEQLNKYNTQELQTEMIKSMREIVSGVGLRDLIDVDQEAIDRVIEESKHDQEALAEEDARQVRMSRKLTVPELQKRKDAGQLSIDDVLLSMGDKGVAVREAVSSIPNPAKPQPAGVLSAVDEALLNMGVRTEPENKTAEGDAAGSKASEVKAAVTEAISDAKETVEETVTEAEAAAAKAVPEMEEAAAEVVSEVEEAAEEAVPEVEEAAAEIVSEVKEAAAEAVPEVEEAAAEAVSEVKEAAAEAVPEVEEAAAEAVSEVKEAAAEAVSEVEETAAEAVPEVEEAAAEAVPGAKTAEIETDSQGVRILSEIPHARVSAAGDAGQDISMEEIMGARTRKVPTDEIAQKHHAAPLGPDAEEAAMDDTAGTEDSQPAEGNGKEGPESRDQAEGTAPAQGAGRGPARLEKRYLKPELRGFFKGYLHVRNMDKQIAGALEQVMAKGGDKTSRTGNILIFGGHGCGKTTVATGLAKAIAQEKGSKIVKMARIYAADLNRKDIAATIAKIAGGVMIVEEAGDLEDSVADQLTTAMEFRTDGMILILEDEQRYMHDLLMRHPRLTMKFTSQIYIPAFTIDELVEFGRIYAAQHDHSISEAGCSVLAKKLDVQVQQGELMSITTVLVHVDNAMARANKFSRKVFSGKKRYDSEGRIILLDKDFR